MRPIATPLPPKALPLKPSALPKLCVKNTALALLTSGAGIRTSTKAVPKVHWQASLKNSDADLLPIKMKWVTPGKTRLWWSSVSLVVLSEKTASEALTTVTAAFTGCSAVVRKVGKSLASKQKLMLGGLFSRIYGLNNQQINTVFSGVKSRDLGLI